MSVSVLVVDDDATIRETLVDFFIARGDTARGAASAADGLQLAREHAPDVVLLDLRLPDANGLDALVAFHADDPDVSVIVLTGFADVRTAVRAMHVGAVDVLEKPVDLSVLALTVQRAAERSRLRNEVTMLRANSVTQPPPFDPTLEQLIDLAARNADAPVLLQGETGTGKGFVARAIHDRSTRRTAPFVEINCASLSTTFVESELFGHERGAFTDAKHAKRGLLELASDGTVFLDEIAELSLDVQPRLLKVLEERTFRRLGGTTSLRSGARVIVATHQPIADAVARGRLRADLYYRLHVLTLTIPPLRTRIGDILPLAHSFLPRGATFDHTARAALEAYAWPGNVRELKNAVWRAAIMADGVPIRAEHLALTATALTATAHSATAHSATADLHTTTTHGQVADLAKDVDSSRTLEAQEADAIREALSATRGNRSHAAIRLGIARSTLLVKLKRYGI